VFVDDETKEATVVVPEDQLALAIGKEGLNARLAARLTGWKVDIQSDVEFAQAEAAAAYGGGPDQEEFSGRCAAILSNGKRCPNASLPGSRFCGVPAHQELAAREAAGESINAIGVAPAETNGDAADAPVAEDDEPAGVVAEAAPDEAEPPSEAEATEEGDATSE
jgi:transcription termination/antitermination protein NusA